MSEIVHYIGKLKEVVPREGETLQEVAKKIYDQAGFTMSDYWKERFDGNWVKALCGETENYVRHNGRLFEVLQKISIDPDGDIANASENDDGTINYEVKYYNGGAGFNEAIDEALSKL